MEKNVRDLIYLLSCAVDEKTPDKAKIEGMDLDRLYSMAKYHSVAAAASVALRSAGVEDERFSKAFNQSVRRTVIFDAERTKILSELEKHKIWYMPLKGSLLKDMYPVVGMREMSDNDILFNKDKHDELREIMLAAGYNPENKEKNHHDAYMKPPVLNFEMHTTLFSHHADEKLRSYYSDISRLLVKDEGNDYGYHMSDEDFYIYMTAHEFNHFNVGGTGLRSLMDAYIFMCEKRDTLDKAYLAEQFEKAGLTDYEKNRSELADKLFSSAGAAELTTGEETLLERYASSGTYGNYLNKAKKAIDNLSADGKKHSKAYYIFRRVFPDLKHMKKHFPQFFRCKLFIPFAYIWRILKVVFKRRSQISTELRAINEKTK